MTTAKRAPIDPKLITWALERSLRPRQDAQEKFSKLASWEDGADQPTFKQAEAFARWAYVPLGFLFLSEPPKETLSVPDFRIFANQKERRLSPSLLDMMYMCEMRQDWYKDYLNETGETALDFVGSANLVDSAESTAACMRETLGFKLNVHHDASTWTAALRELIRHIEEAGVLVMVSGIIGNNPHRKLDVEEFRGFALSDRQAPLIFVNGADTKAAQMFTLVHQLAHIWLGDYALSNLGANIPQDGSSQEEVWCNAVAAEFLVPAKALKLKLKKNEPVRDAVDRLTAHCKVSPLVILRRLLDVDFIDRAVFDKYWKIEMDRFQKSGKDVDNFGGDFFSNTLNRVSRKFTKALVSSTQEGQTLYRDAFRMLGTSRTRIFNELGRRA